MKILLTSLLFVCFSILYGQNKEGKQQGEKNQNTNKIESQTITYGKPIFTEDTPIRITLISDFTKFIKIKDDDKYMPAKMIVHLPDNDSIVKNIRIKTRGKSRKKICYFPPIKLNFKTDPINDPNYAGINKIKMVTHCQRSKIYNAYTLKEYLVYKMFNALTDTSFRVRLVIVDYVDTGKRDLNSRDAVL